jgi:two-component system alkaline phosphatase synthesis response regulator PhoP
METIALEHTGPTPGRETPSLTAGNLHVNLEQYQASVAGSRVTLTYQEFELLRLLAEGRDRILSFDALIDELWHGSSIGTRRRLGVVICRLRAKLSGLWPYRIETVRSRGYGLTVGTGATGGGSASQAD